jgi:hypothetical protein
MKMAASPLVPGVLIRLAPLFAQLIVIGWYRYGEYLDHLAAKLPPGEVQRATLAFDGRNTVLWWEGRPQLQPETPP